MQEAANAERFAREMAAVPAVRDALVVPRVLPRFTARYLLVSQWVDGIKMSDIDRGTVEGRSRAQRVVATLLNAYLVQLLGTGFLHADPHPGEEGRGAGGGKGEDHAPRGIAALVFP